MLSGNLTMGNLTPLVDPYFKIGSIFGMSTYTIEYIASVFIVVFAKRLVL